MKKIVVRLLLFAICLGFLCVPPLTYALPPSDAYMERSARDKEFFQKAIAGKLDCAKEISQRELEFFEDKVKAKNIYDAHYWRVFGTQQCFKALLKAKAFDTALRFIEGSSRAYLNEWWELALEDAVDIPVYATNDKCKSGAEKYDGNEADKIIDALLMGRDLSEHPPGRRSSIEGFVRRMSSFEEYPACTDRKKIIRTLNQLIDLGLEAKFWWEEPMVVGGLTTFSGVMRLGDVELVKRILSGGLGQNPKYLVYLYARAPSVEMVQILEQYFKLKKAEYKAVLQIIDAEKELPENIRKFGAGMASPELITYFEKHAQ